jgi:hypothetical protein
MLFCASFNGKEPQSLPDFVNLQLPNFVGGQGSGHQETLTAR